MIRTPSQTGRSSVCLRLIAIGILPLLAGCDQAATHTEGGPEMRFLNSTPPPLKAAATGPDALLPLAPNTVWHMAGVILSAKSSRGRLPIQKVDIRVADAPPAGMPADTHLVEVRRNGQMWRREVYSNTASGLALHAAAEENRPFMTFAPEVPIAKYPLTEGQSSTWIGRFYYQGQSYPATGFSRVSAIEPIKTALGKRLAFRIDTQIMVDFNGNILKFPTVRWLTPGTGFVRRAFMEGGDGVYVDLVSVQRPGATSP